MNPSLRWKRFKMGCRVAGGLVIVALFVLWAVFGWVNSESGKRWITGQLNHRVPGEVLFEHLEFTFADGVRLGDVTYSRDESGLLIWAECEAFALHDFLWGTASARVYGSTVILNGAPVLFAEQMDVQLPDGIESTASQVSVRDGWIHPEMVLDAVNAAEEIRDPTSSSPPEAGGGFRFPALDVQLERVQVRAAWVQGSPLWSGAVRVGHDLQEIVYDLHGEVEELDDVERRLVLQGVVSPDESWPLTAELTAQSFPVSLESGLDFFSTISGSVRASTHPVFSHMIENDVQLTDVSAVLSATQSLDTAWALVRGQATLANGAALHEVTTSVSHAAVIWTQDESSSWMLPQGRLSASVAVESVSRATTSLLWISDDLGQVVASSSEWPLQPTSALVADVDMPGQPIEELSLHLPDRIVDLFRGVGGTVAARGTLTRPRGGRMRVDGTVDLSDGSYSLGRMGLDEVQISARVQSQPDGMVVTLEGTASALVMQGEEEVYRLDTVPVAGTVTYRDVDQSVRVALTATPGEPYSPFRIEVDPTMSWRAEGSFDVETGVSSLFEALVPDLQRAVEGMGTISVNVAGAGSQVDLELSSDDLVLFSFEAEPSFGMQLRDVVMNASIFPGADGVQEMHGRIQASTPYVSYDGGELEWVDEQLAVDAMIRFGDRMTCSLTAYPPGGGNVTWNHDGVSSQWTLDLLDMESVVVPAVRTWLLQDDEPFWDASGLLSASVERTLIMGEPVWAGVIALDDVTATYRPEPGATIANASMTIPFSYPPSFELLPAGHIDFGADSVRIRNATYEQPQLVIPIAPDRIAYASAWNIPIYGGLVQVQDLRLKDWQGDTPSLGGIIQVTNLDMQRANRLLPFLPYPGTLNGEVDLTRVSTEVLEATGALNADVFDGNIVMNTISIQNPLSGQRIFELDAVFNRIDLGALVEFFDFGEMTGRVNGYARNLRIRQPSSGGWPLPLSFDIDLETAEKGNWMISRRTLEKIVNMGEQTQLTRMVVDRERYLFTEMGLHARLEGNQMRLYGTLRNNLFLASDITKGIEQLFKPSEWFQIPINIKLANPDDVIPFEPVWQRITGQASSP